MYWNSRLEQEHARMIAQCLPKQSVCDIFAGVGPFSIPLAKKGCLVFANDLNPDSFSWLNENKKLNKLASTTRPNLHTFNMDGKLFIKEAHQKLKENLNLQNDPLMLPLFDHYIMNLPASAISFLESFYGLTKDKTLFQENSTKPAVVYCYMFAKLDEDPLTLLKEAMQGYPLIHDSTENTHILNIHNVRRVAPNKDMFCISFKMPADYLSAAWTPDLAVENPEKRARLDQDTN